MLIVWLRFVHFKKKILHLTQTKYKKKHLNSPLTTRREKLAQSRHYSRKTKLRGENSAKRGRALHKIDEKLSPLFKKPPPGAVLRSRRTTDFLTIFYWQQPPQYDTLVATRWQTARFFFCFGATRVKCIKNGGGKTKSRRYRGQSKETAKSTTFH